MHRFKESQGLAGGLRSVLSHGIVTLLAIFVAFALPAGARYVLYHWWPRVQADTSNLLATEIAVASVLVLLFNVTKVAWDNRRRVACARLASLVHVRSNDSWLSRWRETRLVRRFPAVRDVCILTATGYDTFVRDGSLLRSVLESACEVRVMLLNPASPGAQKRALSLSRRNYSLATLKSEIEASIFHLRTLRHAGKKVTLKFYDHAPFWKLAVVGEHVWVQYWHGDCEIARAPEYVFALDQSDPRRGLFVPFYMHFLDKWNETWHPEYDFDANQLVYRDSAGRELKRRPFALTSAADIRELLAGVS
jgi:hypothetical protein